MPEFERGWQSAGLSENDILDLEIALCQNPSMGDLVQGTGGLRKIRWATHHKGKSGGIRVVYVDFVCFERIYLISAYTKAEKDNLNKGERNEIKKLITLLENSLKEKEER